MQRLTGFWKQLGPGLLMAGAAIGVSHLVQSTRAGADFGWQLLWLVIVINLIKYPFFQFGHRYTIATGESLLEGYLRMGRPWLYGFLCLNAFSGVCAIAGVTFVTAALTQGLFGTTLNITIWSVLLMIACLAILALGHYSWLDRIIKPMMAVLFLATISAFTIAMINGPTATSLAGTSASPWTQASLGFLIALMGWMPAPIEMSVWQSLWIKAKENSSGKRMDQQQGKIDFNIGYFMTLILATLFLGLGALVMHGTGETFSNKGAVFSTQLVELYTRSIGDWASPFIAVAAFFAMFSTTLTVVDAYPRSLAAGGQLAFTGKAEHDLTKCRKQYLAALIVCCAIGLLIIHSFLNRLKDLVDMVTTVSFLAAPIFGWLNYRLVTSSHLASEHQPGPALRNFCRIALMILSAISLLYIYSRFISNAN
ncbi:MAG: Nramp family divalent metal transporter [Verrucomicrobiota bacterium]